MLCSLRPSFERASVARLHVALTTQSDPTHQGHFGLAKARVGDCLLYVYINMYPSRSAAPGPPLRVSRSVNNTRPRSKPFHRESSL